MPARSSSTLRCPVGRFPRHPASRRTVRRSRRSNGRGGVAARPPDARPPPRRAEPPWAPPPAGPELDDVAPDPGEPVPPPPTGAVLPAVAAGCEADPPLPLDGADGAGAGAGSDGAAGSDGDDGSGTLGAAVGAGSGSDGAGGRGTVGTGTGTPGTSTSGSWAPAVLTPDKQPAPTTRTSAHSSTARGTGVSFPDGRYRQPPRVKPPERRVFRRALYRACVRAARGSGSGVSRCSSSPRSRSKFGGSERRSPRCSGSSSAPNPGPIVAISNSTPLGSRK